MQSAIDNIKATYDYETCKEIVDHGCQSGVCHEHIYYGDTIKFFENHEDEIIEYIADNLGGEMNEELWTNNTCNYTGYMNDTVWTFIELVAMRVVDEKEEQERNDDETIENYLTVDDVIDYGKGRLTSANDQQASWYNPAGSMNDSRYAQV